MKNKIGLFLFDGFSDWEISFLTPELNKSGKFELVFFSKNEDLVTSMGGLKIKTEDSLSGLRIDDLDMLILPGGIAWEKGGNEDITQFTEAAFEKGKPIAAICAATVHLGQLGLLNDLKHTSNDISYLKGAAPEYCGEKNYLDVPAVTDQNVITANGTASIEFAREIFKKMELYKDADIEKWFQLFKNGIWSE